MDGRIHSHVFYRYLLFNIAKVMLRGYLQLHSPIVIDSGHFRPLIPQKKAQSFLLVNYFASFFLSHFQFKFIVELKDQAKGAYIDPQVSRKFLIICQKL